MAIMTRNDTTAKGRRAAKPEAGPPPAEKGRGKNKNKGKGKGRDKAGPEAFVPTLPSINVLPLAVLERAHVARLRRTFVVLAAAAVAAIAAAFVLQSDAISSANDQLVQEESRSMQLSAEVASLAPVKVYYATVEANKATIQQTMAREVLLSDVVDRLYATAPTGVDLGTVSIAVSSDPVASTDAAVVVPIDPAAVSGACPSPDPYLAPSESAGCVTITGTAVSRAELGDWESQIAKTDLFANLFISSSDAAAEAGPNAITFSASVSVTDAAYLNRYADPAFVEGTTP